MALTWHPTDLHMKPPSKQLASGNRINLAFDELRAVSGVVATMHELDARGYAVTEVSGYVDRLTKTATGATVRVTAGEAQTAYLFVITFSDANETWSRLLTIRVVA